MKIKKMLSQSRRDFTATMVCEHCGVEALNKYGYDDDHYHKEVIPKMKCKSCGKTSSEDYVPQTTRYAAHEVV